jgi:glycosyltransferase involved in cell wall biosynthesis
VVTNPQNASASHRSLKILLVINLPWDARLGAVRVFMEMADAWRRAGHAVSVFSASEAFPNPAASSALRALRQGLFQYKAAGFVHRHSQDFDVVDALIGSLTASKAKLGFGGLLVARSVGLHLLYERFDLEAQRRGVIPKGRARTRVFYGAVHRWLRRSSNASIRTADVVNVPNEEERLCLIETGVPANNVIVQPFGLNSSRRAELNVAAEDSETRQSFQRIVFVGMWSPRKGSKDWGEIMRLVWEQNPDACFRFLGTMTATGNVMRDLGLNQSTRLEVVPEFSQEELPRHLRDCSVGGFPSYVEGFGIAILEQMAAGIPTVAYDVPGPRDMLARLDADLLVPPGDLPAFASALLRVIRLNSEAYNQVSDRCKAEAAAFDWDEIAAETAFDYQMRLAKTHHA